MEAKPKCVGENLLQSVAGLDPWQCPLNESSEQNMIVAPFSAACLRYQQARIYMYQGVGRLVTSILALNVDGVSAMSGFAVMLGFAATW